MRAHAQLLLMLEPCMHRGRRRGLQLWEATRHTTMWQGQ